MKTFVGIKKIVMRRNVEVPLLDIFSIFFDHDNCVVTSCLVRDTESGNFYKFGEDIISGGAYYRAVQCDADGKAISDEVVAISSVYLRGEFIGYTFGIEDVNIY